MSATTTTTQRSARTRKPCKPARTLDDYAPELVAMARDLVHQCGGHHRTVAVVRCVAAMADRKRPTAADVAAVQAILDGR